MRSQILKITKKHSTKSERIFLEELKKRRIPFRAKIKVEGREVDFLIGRWAIDIDCHTQDGEKNRLLVEAGYVPIHYTNREIKNKLFVKLLKWL